MDRVYDVSTTDPQSVALQTMGRVAREAAGTWTMQRLAGEVAAKAAPRDYVGQLRELYNAIVDGWRYTQEFGERVPGTATALLKYVLGCGYNQTATCPSPERCDYFATDWKNKGFGDCDDVSPLVAAGALSLGMVPCFRVAQYPGGAHVSTVVRTPTGQIVSVDPVGHPDKAFGWAMEVPPTGSVQLFDMWGQSTSQFSPQVLNSFGSVPTMTNAMSLPTLYDGPRGGVTSMSPVSHRVVVEPGDPRGGRVLSMPMWSHRLFRRGYVVPDQRAVSQFGERYKYDASGDIWIPEDKPVVYQQSSSPMGARRDRRERRRNKKDRRRDKRKSFRAKVRKKVKRRLDQVASTAKNVNQSQIATLFRAVKSRAYDSKMAQQALATALLPFGVPKQATIATMAREADLARQGGRSKLIELVASGKLREAAKMILSSTGTGIKAGVGGGGMPGMPAPKFNIDNLDISKLSTMMGAIAESPGVDFVELQDGATYTVAPVSAMTGVDNAYNFGQLEVADAPTPGRWYRIQRGDSLLKVTGRAYGLKSGKERTKMSKVINSSLANQCVQVPTEAGSFNSKVYGENIASFRPRWACDPEDQQGRCGVGKCFAVLWIPPAAGVEPPEKPKEDVTGDEVVVVDPGQPVSQPNVPSSSPYRNPPPESVLIVLQEDIDDEQEPPPPTIEEQIEAAQMPEGEPVTQAQPPAPQPQTPQATDTEAMQPEPDVVESEPTDTDEDTAPPEFSPYPQSTPVTDPEMMNIPDILRNFPVNTYPQPPAKEEDGGMGILLLGGAALLLLAGSKKGRRRSA